MNIPQHRPGAKFRRTTPRRSTPRTKREPSRRRPIVTAEGWQRRISGGLAPSLEYGTLTDRATLNARYGNPQKPCPSFARITLYPFPDGIKMVISPAKDAEVRYAKRKPRKSESALERMETEEDERLRAVESHQKSVERSKRQIRNFCRYHQCDRMGTLTARNGAGMATREQALAVWARFLRLFRKVYGDRPMLAVLERHTGNGPNSGTYHVHFVFRGFVAYGYLNRMAYKALGGTGRESGSATPGGVKVTESHGAKCYRAAARYIGKYIGKAIGDTPPGHRRYMVSGAPAETPRTVVYTEADPTLVDRMGRLFTKITGRRPRFYGPFAAAEGGEVLVFDTG